MGASERHRPPRQAPLLYPFRALGYITDSVPFSLQKRGKERYVTVSAGNTWQVYNTQKLTLTLVGPQFQHSIVALANHRDFVLCAAGSSPDIHVSRRSAAVGALSLPHAEAGPVLSLLTLGDTLHALHASRLVLWDLSDLRHPGAAAPLADIQLAGRTPTCMAHPDTYLNKLVLGTSCGRLQLWNTSTAKLVFENAGFGSGVRCVVPSPALDVVGVGLTDGRAVLYNLRFDEVLCEFQNASGAGLKQQLFNERASASGGPCTAIAFRSGAGAPLMAAGGAAGVITVWNLAERKLHTTIKDAHDGALVSLKFFPNEPVLMSSAADNSLKQWMFDGTDGTARLLKFRSGHAAPPTCVAHYAQGQRLLSAGQDRALRVFSSIQDQQSRELSQGHIAKRAKRLKVRESELKLTRVVGLDSCDIRERDWSNVITAHEREPRAYTWRLKDFTLGEHVLEVPKKCLSPGEVAGPVTCVALSRCGNYGLVGGASGRVDRYNMQSGIHRAMYRRGSRGAWHPAHDGPVAGVACDACNTHIISAGVDGALRVWAFKRKALLREVRVGAPITHMAQHPGSGLTALACEDLTLRMYDPDAGRLVRRFSGHSDRISALHIASDGRWLLSASMDGTLRVWDIPAARCLQVMATGAPITALSMSPALDTVATTHINRRGVYLWSNQTLFGSHVITPSTHPVDLSLPSVSGAVADSAAASSDSDGESSTDEDEAATSSSDVDEGAAQAPPVYSRAGASGAPTPLTPALVTLSSLPASQWRSLLHLDLISARNKPIQPPQKPEAAPFFLPTTRSFSGAVMMDPDVAPDENPALTEDATMDGAAAASTSRVLQGGFADQEYVSEFVRLLRAGAEAGDWTALVTALRGMTPAAVDGELQAMGVYPGAGEEEVGDISLLLDFVLSEVEANRNFEYVQAFLAVVLKTHGEAIMESPTLTAQAGVVHAAIKRVWARMHGLLRSVQCMVGHLGNLHIM